jgi:hypothetical protein
VARKNTNENRQIRAWRAGRQLGSPSSRLRLEKNGSEGEKRRQRGNRKRLRLWDGTTPDVLLVETNIARDLGKELPQGFDARACYAVCQAGSSCVIWSGINGVRLSWNHTLARNYILFECVFWFRSSHWGFPCTVGHLSNISKDPGDYFSPMRCC